MAETQGPPPAEVDIDEALVHRVLRRIDPVLDKLPLQYLDTGWDNVVFRLGGDLLVRAPRRAQAETLIRRELRWLPELARSTGLKLPYPLWHAAPDFHYPFTLTISQFLPGHSALVEERVLRDDYALEFGAYLQSLHCPAPAAAPRSSFRGVALRELDTDTCARIRELDQGQATQAEHIWDQSLAAQTYEGAPLWLHGDPHPHNTIVNRAEAAPLELMGLVDFGDLCSGDPASDWGMYWLHFSPTVRDQVLARHGILTESPGWVRARGWALRYALVLHRLPAEDRLGDLGRETLRLVLESS